VKIAVKRSTEAQQSMAEQVSTAISSLGLNQGRKISYSEVFVVLCSPSR